MRQDEIDNIKGIPDSVVVGGYAQQAVAPNKLEDNKAYSFLDANGGIRVERTGFAEPAPLPDHITANRVVADPESFIAYVERHYGTGTEVYANLATSSVIAILDSHESSSLVESPDARAQWNDHKLTLTLEKTPAWKAWETMNGRWLGQVEFAEHIEDNLSDILEPTAADFLEMAQSFQATRGVEFKSSQRLSTGETKISYSEDTNAKAGRSGDLTIPEEFVIGVIPFIGGTEGYRVKARFRYRLRDGDLSLAYKLDRPEKVLENAFGDILATIKAGLTDTGVPVFHGRP